MTINRISKSIIASALIVTTSFAGTIGSQTWTVSEELVSNVDLNATLGLTLPTYTPTDITLGSLTDPVFNLTITGGTIQTSDDIALYAPN